MGRLTSPSESAAQWGKGLPAMHGKCLAWPRGKTRWEKGQRSRGAVGRVGDFLGSSGLLSLMSSLLLYRQNMVA